MGKLILLLSISLGGCATTVEMVTAVYKPKKSGVIKVPDTYQDYSQKSARMEATRIMKKFCSPVRPVLVSLNRDSQVTGATSSQWNGVTFSQNQYSGATLIHFICSAETGDEILFSDVTDETPAEDDFK